MKLQKNEYYFFQNKKATLSINALVITILVILVLIAGIIFLRSPWLWDKIRNLPGYQYDDTDKTIDSTKIKDKDVLGSCPITVGKVQGVSEGVTKYLFTTNYIFVDNKQTALILNKNTIELDEKINEDIGILDSNNLVKIDSQWFTEEIRSKHTKLPSLTILQALNGSYKLSTNELCRVEEVKINKLTS